MQGISNNINKNNYAKKNLKVISPMIEEYRSNKMKIDHIN